MKMMVDTPRLTDGVSQQPDIVRYRSQAEAVKNSWMSLVTGLDKRNGSSHIAQVSSVYAGDNYWTHWIDTISENLDVDPDTALPFQYVAPQQYLVMGTRPNQGGTAAMRMFELDGTEIHIEDVPSSGGTLGVGAGTTAPSWAYFDTDLGTSGIQGDVRFSARETLKLITIADTTFVVNRQKVVAMDPAFKTTSPPNGKAFIFVRAGNYEMDYEVLIETSAAGTSTQTVTTWNGIVDANASPPRIQPVTPPLVGQTHVHIRTDDIAEQIKLKLDATGVSATRVGSVVMVEGTTFEKLVRVEGHDGIGDTNIEILFEGISTAVDLPLTCEDGFKIRVTGDATIGGDDYFIKFVAADGSGTFGTGSWEQTIDHDTEYQFDSATMPHTLTRKIHTSGALPSGYTPDAGEIYFAFEEATWDERVTGDEVTVPDPSFVGNSVENVFLVRNRLGFVSDDNIIMTAVNGFFNFWRTDLANLLDSDTIDVAIGHSDVSFPRMAIPFENDLIVFTDRHQFRIPGEEPLTPKTIAVRHISSYWPDLDVDPVMADTGVYFAENHAQYSAVQELYRRGDSRLFQAAKLSEQVPRYIPGKIREMTSSSNSSCLAVVLNDPSADNADRMFIYNFHWSGRDRTQSAWQEWSLGCTKILSAHFFKDILYVMVERNSQVYLESIDTSIGGSDLYQDFRVKMDRKVALLGTNGTYSADTNYTRWTLPYDLAAADEVQGITWSFQPDSTPSNALLNIAAVNRATPGAHYIDVVGDWTNATRVWIGIKYTMEYEFGSILTKLKDSSQGRSEYSVSSGANQVYDGLLMFENAGPFEVEVTPRGQDAYTYDAPIRVLDDVELGQFAEDGSLATGEFPFPVMADARSVTIKILNSSPMPAQLTKVEWSIDSRPKHRRIG